MCLPCWDLAGNAFFGSRKYVGEERGMERWYWIDSLARYFIRWCCEIEGVAQGLKPLLLMLEERAKPEGLAHLDARADLFQEQRLLRSGRGASAWLAASVVGGWTGLWGWSSLTLTALIRRTRLRGWAVLRFWL